MGDQPELSSISVEDFLQEWQTRLSATGQHQATADRLINLYRKLGLLPGDRDEALFECCPHKDECWRHARPANDQRNSGISIPWIGRRFFDSRVVILGINFDNFGGLAGHYHVCKSHIEAMEAGKRGKDGRPFSRGAMQYLRLVLASLNGDDLPMDSTSVTNEELAVLWEECAYLQRIKCAPGGDRSKPTDAMTWNCPPFLAMAELTVLEPRVILHLGRTDLRREWIVQEGGYGEEQGKHMERDTATVGDSAVELISLNHPSTSRLENITASLDQLVASLRARPIGTES